MIRLHEVINDEEDENIYLVLDYAQNGELIGWDEDDKRFYFRDPLMKSEEFLAEI